MLPQMRQNNNTERKKTIITIEERVRTKEKRIYIKKKHEMSTPINRSSQRRQNSRILLTFMT